MNRRRKISTTVYLTQEQDDALHALQDATGVPMAEWVRRGVDLALAAQKATPRRVLGEMFPAKAVRP